MSDSSCESLMDVESVMQTESAFDLINSPEVSKRDVFKTKQNKELIENIVMAVYSSEVNLPVVSE
jgi:hypothetical protein